MDIQVEKADANKTYQEVVFSTDWEKGRSDSYFEYRAMWDVVANDCRTLEFPLHLDIETTTHCNLKCPMCPRTIMIDKGTFGPAMAFMSISDFRNIIDQAVQHGAASIKLNYLGEPMLHKDIYRQIHYAKINGIIDVMMNTNGTALTPKNNRKLLEAGLDKLFVSLDAANPKDFATQRVGASLGQVIDGLYDFIQQRNSINPGCQVRISMVMYDDPKWLDQFKALQIMWKGLVDAVGYGFFNEHTSDDGRQEYPEVPGFRCSQPFQRMFLKMNGNVTVCCVDSADEWIMGNWRRTNLKDIWLGDFYENFRRMHRDGHYYDAGMCRKCYLPTYQGKHLEEVVA